VLELSQNAKNMTKIIFFTKYFSSLYVPLKEASTRMDYVFRKRHFPPVFSERAIKTENKQEY